MKIYTQSCDACGDNVPLDANYNEITVGGKMRGLCDTCLVVTNKIHESRAVWLTIRESNRIRTVR
jgi:hypothetical protein